MEEPDAAVEIIVDGEISAADWLPADHDMNDPSCECAACTYPLN